MSQILEHTMKTMLFLPGLIPDLILEPVLTMLPRTTW